jgi:steroid delta-isomerase-like uncharacterized protein
MLARAERAFAAWNRRDADGVVADVADDVIWRDAGLGMPLQGREALRAVTWAYMTAFPDLRVTAGSYTIDGLRLVYEWVSTGTHQGVLMGLAPTGRWIENYGATVTTCDEDGLVIEGAAYWNPLVMYRQLGLEAAPAGTAATAITPSSTTVATTARALRPAEFGGASTLSSSPAAT